jgi:hypothetical protein
VWDPRTGAAKPTLDCFIGGIPNGGVQSCSITPEFFTVWQDSATWACFGILSSGADDWDIRLFDNLATRAGLHDQHSERLDGVSGVDFVVGDYNHCPLTQEWMTVNR